MSPYSWPQVTAIHPDLGSIEMDVHCVRSPDGEMVVIAFMDTGRKEQVKLLRRLAKEMGDEIVHLNERDITQELAAVLAAQFAVHKTRMVLAPVERNR